MVRTKTNTQNDTKTRTTSLRNRYLEKLYFCVFRIFLFLFSFLFIISLMNITGVLCVAYHPFAKCVRTI